MTIHIEWEYEGEGAVPADGEALIRRVIEAALDYEDCPYEVQVEVLVTDNESIRQINLDSRGIDAPTDVLSFPSIAYEVPGDFSGVEDDPMLFEPESGELMLGDMVISMDKVREQADAYGHTQKRELAFLTAHSMFHLMGYDHMEEGERLLMEEKQRELLAQMGITR